MNNKCRSVLVIVCFCILLSSLLIIQEQLLHTSTIEDSTPIITPIMENPNITTTSNTTKLKPNTSKGDVWGFNDDSTTTSIESDNEVTKPTYKTKITQTAYSYWTYSKVGVCVLNILEWNLASSSLTIANTQHHYNDTLYNISFYLAKLEPAIGYDPKYNVKMITGKWYFYNVGSLEYGENVTVTLYYKSNINPNIEYWLDIEGYEWKIVLWGYKKPTSNLLLGDYSCCKLDGMSMGPYSCGSWCWY